MLRNTLTGYGQISKVLHWLLFLMIVGLIAGGLLAEAFGEELEKLFMGLHMATGAVVLALVVVRVLWRFSNPVPALPVAAPRWENMLAKITHAALYLMMLAQPLTGVLMTQYKGYPLSVYGLFEIPVLVAKDKATGHFFEELHETGWIVLALLIALHVAAALYHHFVRRDDILRRMTTG